MLIINCRINVIIVYIIIIRTGKKAQIKKHSLFPHSCCNKAMTIHGNNSNITIII